MQLRVHTFSYIFRFRFRQLVFTDFPETWSFSWVKVPPWALQKLLYWGRKHLSVSKGKREPLKTKKKDCCKTACTLLNSFTVYKIQHTHGKDGFYGFCGAMQLGVRTFSYTFYFRFSQNFHHTRKRWFLHMHFWVLQKLLLKNVRWKKAWEIQSSLAFHYQVRS